MIDITIVNRMEHFLRKRRRFASHQIQSPIDAGLIDDNLQYLNVNKMLQCSAVCSMIQVRMYHSLVSAEILDLKAFSN